MTKVEFKVLLQGSARKFINECEKVWITVKSDLAVGLCPSSPRPSSETQQPSAPAAQRGDGSNDTFLHAGSSVSVSPELYDAVVLCQGRSGQRGARPCCSAEIWIKTLVGTKKVSEIYDRGFRCENERGTII